MKSSRLPNSFSPCGGIEEIREIEEDILTVVATVADVKEGSVGDRRNVARHIILFHSVEI